MKQITLKQAASLALACEYRLRLEIKFCQEDWVRENAKQIADIEMKRADKTFFGEWPKGWRHEMKRAADENARADILARFLDNNCKQLDGAIWLNNWELIQEMEGAR